MKLELEKEPKTKEGKPWYRITLDDKYIDGSFDFESIKDLYERIKADPNMLNSERETLLSEEI